MTLRINIERSILEPFQRVGFMSKQIIISLLAIFGHIIKLMRVFTTEVGLACVLQFVFKIRR